MSAPPTPPQPGCAVFLILFVGSIVSVIGVGVAVIYA